MGRCGRRGERGHVRGADGLLQPRVRPEDRRHLHDHAQHHLQPGRPVAWHLHLRDQGCHRARDRCTDRLLRRLRLQRGGGPGVVLPHAGASPRNPSAACQALDLLLLSVRTRAAPGGWSLAGDRAGGVVDLKRELRRLPATYTILRLWSAWFSPLLWYVVVSLRAPCPLPCVWA